MTEQKIVGLETSAIMPLVELTTRTLPLQRSLIEAQKIECKFITDRYSIMEGRNVIKSSYQTAIDVLSKTREVIKRENILKPIHIGLVFIKILAEDWGYGRHQALKWSDVVLNLDLNDKQSDVCDKINEELTKKRDRYFDTLTENVSEIEIDISKINSYWISPEYLRNFSVKISIIDNKISLQDFFSELEPIINSVYKEKISINDVIDFYHLYSLYYDDDIKEVWSCNQKFVKRHEKYLKNLNSNKFSEVFKNVRIKRIE